MKDVLMARCGGQNVGVVATLDMAHSVPNRCHTPSHVHILTPGLIHAGKLSPEETTAQRVAVSSVGSVQLVANADPLDRRLGLYFV